MNCYRALLHDKSPLANKTPKDTRKFWITIAHPHGLSLIKTKLQNRGRVGISLISF